MRLDQYLFEQNMAQSRERAKALVMAGIVYLNGNKAEKPGIQVPQGAVVELRGNDLRYVSRGGLKLEKALEVFPITPLGKVCVDVGASTGGFTDCMLQNGAEKVYAIDVGYGQLAWKLRCDERVVVMERTNFRNLEVDTIPDRPAFFSVDVSFISLQLILPVMARLVEKEATGVCLVKPQFEAGRDKVGKKGVVRSSQVHIETIQHCVGYAASNGFACLGLDYSPITGPEGNIEFLLCLQRTEEENAVIGQPQIEQVVQAAAQALQGGNP